MVKKSWDPRERKQEVIPKPLNDEERDRSNLVIKNLEKMILSFMRPVTARLGFIEPISQLTLFFFATVEFRDTEFPQLPVDEVLDNMLDQVLDSPRWRSKAVFSSILSTYVYRYAQDELEHFRGIVIPNSLLPPSFQRPGRESTKFWVRQLSGEIPVEYLPDRSSFEQTDELHKLRFFLAQSVILLKEKSQELGSIAEFLVYGAETHKTCIMETPSWTFCDKATIGNYCRLKAISWKDFNRLRAQAVKELGDIINLLDSEFTSHFLS